MIRMAHFDIEQWGMIDYMQAWDRQKVLQARVQRGEQNSTLVLCQHPTVITIGKNGTHDNVNLSEYEAHQLGVQIIANNRGGDVTLHNPGQLIGYPIFRLTDFKPDLHWFLRQLEECIIQTIARFGLQGGRVEGLTGVWLESDRKICAMGLHCSRWVTSHGFALNITNNMEEFDWIIPCGITDKKVTSMHIEMQKVAHKLDDTYHTNTEYNTLLFDAVQSVCHEVFRGVFSSFDEIEIKKS
jgi:lipoyl(octanoyl) transferase